MSELVLRDSDGVTEAGAFRFTSCTLEITGEPSLDEWNRFGEFLQRMEGASRWVIGDWLRYGEKRYGEMYKDAMEATGFDYGTLRNAKVIAGAFELSRRRDNLPFTAHAEVASLPPEQADAILDQAESEGLTTREVRTIVRNARQAKAKPKEDFFNCIEERELIEAWLKGRLQKWPPYLQPTFTNVVNGILQNIEQEADENNRRRREGSTEPGNSSSP